MSRSGKRFYLDKENKKLSGVCAGIADYFEWDVTLVRIIWVVATIVWAPVMIVAYILMAWLVDPKPLGLAYDRGRAGYGDGRRETVRPSRARFADVRTRFDSVEDRLRTLEQVVTSREFQMDRELRGVGRV